MLRVILCRKTMQLIVQVGLFMMMGWFTSSCLADEILFKDKGIQAGTVIDDDKQAVTNRFPTDSSRSAVRTQQGVLLAQKSDTQLILEKLEQLEQRIERLERKQAEPKQTGLPPTLLPRSDKKQEESKGIGSSSPPPPEPASKDGPPRTTLTGRIGASTGGYSLAGEAPG